MAVELATAYVSIVPSLRGVERDLSRQLVPPAEGAGDQAGTAAGRSFSETFKKAAKVAGLAAGAALAGGLFESVDREAQNAKLTKQLGLTPEESAKAGQVAGDLYAGAYGDSLEQVNDAIKSVVQNIGGMKDASAADLQRISADVLNVAGTFDQDLGGVTNAISQMLKTGLASNAGEALDILTAGFQNGADKAGDLLDTFNEYGVQFRKLGVDGTQALGLIQQGLQGGARDADLVADSLKEFSIRAIDGSKTTSDGFKALGLDAGKMAAAIAKGGPSANAALDQTLDRLRGIQDPVQRSAAAVALFGTQAEDLGNALYSIDPSAAVSGLGDISQAVEGLDTMSTADQFESFKRQLIGFASDLASTLLPALNTAATFLNNTIGPAFKAVTGFVKDHDTAVRIVAIGIGGLWAAYKGYQIVKAAAAATQLLTARLRQNLAMLTYNATYIKISAAVTRVWTAVQAAFNAVMSANPIALAVVAIAALGAALVIAYKKSATFRAIVQAAWSAIKDGLAAAWSFIQPVIGALVTAFKSVGDALAWAWNNVLRPVWSAIQTAIGVGVAAVKIYIGVWTAIFKGIGDGLSWAWDNVLKPVWEAIQTAIGIGVDVVKGYISIWIAIFKTIGDGLSWAWENVIEPVWGWIKLGIGVVKDVVSSAVSAVSKVFSTIGDGLSSAWNFISGIYTKIKDGIGSVASWISEKVDAIFGFFSGLPGRLANVFGGMWDGIKDAFKSVFNVIIRWWNDFDFTAPKVHIPGTNIDVGGFTIGLPDIPYLARGGLTTGLTAAVLGDNPSGQEAVLPMDSTKTVALFASAFDQAGRHSKFGPTPNPPTDVAGVVTELRALRKDITSMRVVMDNVVVGRVIGTRATLTGRTG